MMQLASSPRTYRRGLDFYLAFIGLVTLIYGLITARVSRSWIIADWLINYQAGFVRRGFAGEVAYLLGRALHLSPVVFIVVFYLSLYGILLLAVRSLAFRSSWNLWVLAILVSPATLSFQVLDATAGFRKELIYLAALTLLLVLLERSLLSATATAGFLGLVLLVAILSHESLICFAPYFFAALVVTGRSPAQAARQFIVPLLLGVGAAYFSARHLGDLNTAAQICSSLGYTLRDQGREICSGGAIPYLASTRARAIEDARVTFRAFPYLRIYLSTAPLALAPVIAGSIALVRSGRNREVRVIWCMAALSFASSLILFFYATDWGRWIYIHVLSIAVLLLCVDGLNQNGLNRERQAHAAIEVQTTPVRRRRRAAACLALIAYATLWTLPHVPGQTPRFGYISLVRYVLAYGQHHPALSASVR